MQAKHFALSAIALSLALIGQTQAADIPVTQYQYDANGNLVSQNNALNETTSYAYDRLDRVTRIDQPLGETIQLQRNTLDQPVQITDPKGLHTGYQRNGLGELLNQTSPDTGLSKTTYNSNGQLDSSTDAKGQKSNYRYDSLGRLSQITYNDGGSSQYTYDEGDYAKGFLTSSREIIGGAVTSQQWQYRQGGLLASKTQRVGDTSQTVQYRYDSLDRVSQIIYPSGNVLEIGYWNGDIKNLTYNGQIIASNIQTDAFGGLKQLTLGNGITQQRTLDKQGRISRYTLNGQIVQLSYDAANRLFRQTGPDGAFQYAYDAQGRLIQYLHGPDVTEYRYDKNGNRTSVIKNGHSQPISVDPASNREAGKQYDANGSLTNDGRQFTYRSNGRLESVTAQNERTVYHYNALGERVRKSNNLEETSYVYDEDGQLLGEYRLDGPPKVEYLWLGNIPVGVVKYSMDGQWKLYYVESDQLNTPRELTAQDRQVVWQWRSEPFGSSVANDNPAGLGTITYNLRFPGQYYDRESGLHYNYYRDYDPQSGRYVESDPVGLEAGVNTYVYVGSNPLSLVDPDGLATPSDIRLALSVLHDLVPEIYEKYPASVTPVKNLSTWYGAGLQGYTDLSNNIQINANLYGDCKTPVDEFLVEPFLQTIAHEWMHVQQSAVEKTMTHGPLHNQIDRNAEILSRTALNEYLKRRKNKP